jgi:hypothetical protein
LDSVKHFEPKCYRTVAYQAILVEYLRYVKERGFHTAHIWSCPPTPGDDYIFYSHPPQQLIPHEDMLRTWYHQMLATAKAQGVVIRTTTLYDEYFTSEGGNNTPARGDPTCLPYFEGDYIPGELENIIKLLKRDGHGSNDKSSTSQDEVMRRLGHNLSKMKDNFIVVHLRSRRFAAAVERGEDVSEWLEDSDDELVRSKRAKISGKDFIPYLEEKPTQDSAIAADDLNSPHPALTPIGATKVAPTSESQDATERSVQVVGEGAVSGKSKPTFESQDATETSAKVVGEGVVSGESKSTSECQDATETSAKVMGEGVVSGESKSTPESQDATETSAQVMGEGVGVVSGESKSTSESQDATETSAQVMGEGVVSGESKSTSESQDATEASAQVMGDGVVSGESKFQIKMELTSDSKDATETSAQVPSGEAKSQVDETSKAGPVSESAADELKKEPQPQVASEQDAAGRKSGTGATAEDVKATPDENAETTLGVALLPVVNESSASPQDMGASGVGSIASKQLSREEPSVAAEGETTTESPTTLLTEDPSKATESQEDPSKDVFTDPPEAVTTSQEDPGKDVSTDPPKAVTTSQEDHTKDVSTDPPKAVTTSQEDHTKDVSTDPPKAVTTSQEDHTKDAIMDEVTESPETVRTSQEDCTKDASTDKVTESLEAVTTSQEDHTKDVSADKATESLEAVTTSQEDHTKDVSADKATESLEAVTTSQEDHTKNVSADKATELREAVTTSTTEKQLIDGSQDAAGIASKDTSAFSGQVAIKSEENDSISSGPGKRGIDEIGPALSRHAAEMKSRGPKLPVAGTVDEDEPMDSEMFESRQQFLNYCQTNHCQFDELRRTKHSTMMVLFQLHNPMAPLVLNQCGACYRDITHGVRYHCNDCSNFDLCQECYEPVTTGLWAQRDPRFAHAENHSFTPVDMEASEETEKTREERQLSLKSHLDLLEHVASCGGPPDCSLHNCQRMKKLFEHVSSCEIKPKKECKVCTRLFSLCSVHARTCGARESCPIPFCDRIRESNKRRRQQQQQMDDRRRRAQNELYHAGGSEQG